MATLAVVLLLSASVAPIAVAHVGTEGCSHGFWKNHNKCWHCFAPEDPVGCVFLLPPELRELGSDTLLDALKYKGGKGIEGPARNLLRQGVAALLNSCDPDVHYPMGVGEVAGAIDTALHSMDRGEMLAIKDMLDRYNNLGCPIDAHCELINGCMECQ